MKMNPYHAFFRFTPWPTGGVSGSGTANEIAYWNTASTIASLTTATYPSLTELSYVKGVSSAIQTQFTGKASTALSNLASVAINTTLVSDTDNTDALGTTAIAWSDLFLGSGAVIQFNSAPSTSDVTITHSANALDIDGGVVDFGSVPTVNTAAIYYSGGTDVAVADGGTGGSVASITLFNNITGYTAAGATGTTITNLVFSTSPQLTTSLTTDSTTFALLNATATTINFAGAATTLNVGASATCILNFGGSTTASEFRFLEPSGSGTNYTAFKAVAQGANITYSLPPTVGAAGTYLRDVAGDGVLTWAAVSSTSTPKVTWNYIFSATTGGGTDSNENISEANTGGGATTFGNTGANMDTSATITSGTLISVNLGTSTKINPYAGSPSFTTGVRFGGTVGTDLNTLFCIGEPNNSGGAISYTIHHTGFKITRAASGTISLFATQGDGTTETASSALLTVATNDFLDLILQMNSTTSVDYYYRQNGGTLSSATNLTTNMPTATTDQKLSWKITNVGVATQTDMNVSSASYSR